jgi:TetR/AcrR family transcriptional regulator, transcriptional repressor of bet genes
VSPKPAYRRAEPDARRLSLIEACARVLAREGASGASVRTIALEAGVSPGLVGHYFGSVDALVAATYGHTGARVDAALEAALSAAGAVPRAQLEAYVTASFTAPIADPQLLATWVAFWSLVRTRADIAGQHDVQYASFRARLEGLLAACGLPGDRLRLAAIAISALVDGLWLELCLSPGTFTADDACSIARAQIDAFISPNQ